MNRLDLKVIALHEARQMEQTGLAISAISKLIQENETRKAFVDGGEFLDSYTLSGLAMALEVLADGLIDRGSEVSALIETGEA
jgi:hypothetical protein